MRTFMSAHVGFHACQICVSDMHEQRSSIRLVQVLELIQSRLSHSLKHQALDASLMKHVVHSKQHDLGHSGFPMTLTRLPRDHVCFLVGSSIWSAYLDVPLAETC